MIFGIKEKSRIFTHTMYFLAISTNIHQRLKIGFVVQGHIHLTAIKIDEKEGTLPKVIFLCIITALCLLGPVL